MTMAADPRQLAAQVAAQLAGPGGPFALTVEPVLGTELPVFVNRRRSLGIALTDSRAWGDRDYLVTAERRWTYTEHADAAGALAAGLAARYGVGKGDRVAILAANSPEWVIAFWAAQSLGAIAVGYNAWWAPREIDYALGHSTPTVVIADAARAEKITGTDIPVLTVEDDLPALFTEFAGNTPETEVAEDDPAVILYTSGTSGRPKGVVHTHRNLLAVTEYHRFTEAMADTFAGVAFDPDRPSAKRWLLSSPLFHIASLHNLVVPRIATGAAVIFPESKFDASRVLRLIERERVTHWGAVPTMAIRLLEQDLAEYDLSSLSAFSLNTAPSSPALHQRLREALPVQLATSYGLTEAGTAATLATPPELAAFPETVGGPIIGVSVAIRDPEGNDLPEGTEGEICVRSPYVMLGYWNDPPATAAALDGERWLRTGDFGLLRDGRLYLVGRRSDLILRGGENVYPTEIENVLDEHPAVAESAVFGVADPDLGQAVAALVVTTSPVTEDELREFAAARLAYFKIPAHWRLTPEALPRNATGKVVRRDLSL
ncbi:class I adenylate-forming enzyme family protein [Nocardia sp. NPDC057353]|uniref:class I adenylate-forming enzyme family protein n=1 Tax=Nocardia sp. NPDC057353 TaxID=3346104 RepID=UPI00363437BC